MSLPKVLITCVCTAILAVGCAGDKKDVTGFALERTASVQAPFKETWQAVKSALREQDLEIYTRDKRGTFVAYRNRKSAFLNFFRPKRMQYTIEIASVSEKETAVYIETMQQVYGVTLLTHPAWHDRRTSGNTEAEALLESILAKTSAD